MSETINSVLYAITTILVLGWAVFVAVALYKTWGDGR